jgi:hypothetical protein
MSSNSATVSYSIRLDGVAINDIQSDGKRYHLLSIPGEELMMQIGAPQLPLVTRLIAVPDCEHISLSIVQSNEERFEGFSIPPTPAIRKVKSPMGDLTSLTVHEEDPVVYQSNNVFPGKQGEILEVGYVRSQKVVRVALYPVKFNPVKSTLYVSRTIEVTLTFTNPSSPINKELGSFGSILRNIVPNYHLEETGRSISDQPSLGPGLTLGKLASGSVTRITNLNLLVGPSALPVDYLIVTHSNLYNSVHLTSLANHRRDRNGFDVVICQVDAPGSNNDIYDFEDTPGHVKYPSTEATRYQSVRNFIADVYINGRADHIGDGHLGYCLLVGDALQDDNTTKMVPAAYPTRYDHDCEFAGDYYYACTGGDADDLMDVMYGRLPVGNEGELGALTNKIISFENNANGSWCSDNTFVAFSPDLYQYADPAIRQLT